MIKNELIKVYAYVKSIFTNFPMPVSKMEIETRNIVWFKFLHSYELDVIFLAIDNYAKENQFVNIAQIASECDKVLRLLQGNYKDEFYYLDEITKAISYSNSKVNYDRLSEFSKSIVTHPAMLARWCNMGEDFYKFERNTLLKKIVTKLKQEELKNNSLTNQVYLQQFQSNLIENNVN